jgi:hypothetical protein
VEALRASAESVNQALFKVYADNTARVIAEKGRPGHPGRPFLRIA